MTGKLVVFVVVLSVVAGTLWITGVFGGEAKQGPGAKNTHVVQRGVLKITLTERGTLKAKKSTQIRAETHGKLSWLAEEGAKVKKGDILVKMDTEQLTQQIDQLSNQITQGEAELKSAETEVTVQEGQNLTNQEKADLNLAVAEVELEKLLQSDIPAKERELLLAIEEAETQLERAKDNVKASEELLKEDFVTPNDHKDTLLKLKKAQNNLETTKMKSESYYKYEKPLDLRRKRAAVEEAKRGRDRAIQQADAQLNAKRARMTQRKVNLTRVKQRHKRESEKLEKMVLKAPTDGTVLIGDPDNPWNSERIKVGNQVYHRMVLMTLPDSRELAVTIQVHEADIAKLKKGMKAFITSETNRDLDLKGEITKIDTVANAGRRWGGGDNVKRFKVELSLIGEDIDLKTGTSAEVEVLVDEIADVLTVPAQAIHIKEGKRYCYVKRAARAHRVPVETGRSNDAFVEIKRGVEEGDEVYLSTPESYEIDEDVEAAFDKETKAIEAKKAAERKKKEAERRKKAEERKQELEAEAAAAKAAAAKNKPGKPAVMPPPPAGTESAAKPVTKKTTEKDS